MYFYILEINNWKLTLKNKANPFLIAEAFSFSQDGITGTRFDLLPEKCFKNGQNMKQKFSRY